ncbi:hypothetical protein PI124_g14372 [Phytophthora idaei]|nr:hypothetical protein PI125_g16115 [Phytophthora idaei]KAG3141542.1 hypothetical protein PI126_g15453 [Phytophthora idaei]KAG3240750.1 hypothetical protein PI124_g14372 [Phytophthora idaei]
MLSLSNDLSSDEELANEETGEDLEQEIVTHASVYDFSLDWDGDQESEESSGTDEELPSTNESSCTALSFGFNCIKIHYCIEP